jgi:hypothetical protein
MASVAVCGRVWEHESTRTNLTIDTHWPGYSIAQADSILYIQCLCSSKPLSPARLRNRGPREVLLLRAAFISSPRHLLRIQTYVLYVLNADRVHVNVGRCSFGSHSRACRWRIGSSVGGLSTMYDIQARLHYQINSITLCLGTNIPSGLDLRAALCQSSFVGCSMYTHGSYSASL